MNKFQYLDYQDVNNKIEEMINSSENINQILKQKPLGYTSFGLPINHYTIGNGPKHIVVSGSYHAAEIITTIFAVRLMEAMSKDDSFKADEYTIDFIPIVNPEGYLITTEMQDLYLGKATTEEEKIARAKVYWASYRADTTIPAKVKKGELPESALREKKAYQALFDDVNLDEYLKNYPEIKDSVLDIVNKNNYPIGVLAAWTANANGIDLSQNVPYNPAIKNLLEANAPVYNHLAYANTRKDIPGPINTPCQNLKNFYFEPENLAILNFFENLNYEPGVEIIAYFNYHSVMGKMYQRPVKEEGIINLYDIDYDKKVIENYISSRIFRTKNAYDIIETEDPYSYMNEYLRLRYGIDIQVELSRMGSNPIGPLADPNTFENVTVKPNIEAFKHFVKDYDFIQNYTEFISSLVKKLKIEYPTLEVSHIYELIDKISRENPTLYTKLEEELRNKGSYNAHVISYFYDELKKALSSNRKENEAVKKIDQENSFNIGFHTFLSKIIEELNSKRKEPLTKEEIDLLIDNIFRDYPELIAKIKYNFLNNLATENLYSELSAIIDNQIKMGNLMNKSKREGLNPFNFPDIDILVNKENPLPDDYEASNIIEINNPYYSPLIPGTKLTISSLVNDAFQFLKEDVKKQGYELWIDSGYRTREYQEIILQNYIKEMGNAAYDKVALPGTSEHESGLAIDCGIVIDGEYIDELPENAPITKWIHENCYKYGFILRYPKGKEEITGYKYEPWHLRYVGPKLAKYLTENDLTLDEYYLNKDRTR